MTESPKEMSFLDHLEELRRRLLKSIGAVFAFTFAAFPFTGVLLEILTFPNDRLPTPAKMIFLKPTGMLMIRVQIALAAGFIVALPVVVYQLWKFISPGLLEKEKKYIFPTILFTTFCFLVGISFAYFILIPTVLPFLFSMGTESIEPTININDYMSFVLRLILVAGLIFEFPVLSFFLSRVGVLTPTFLKKYSRYGIVIMFVLSALITPPDPMSQVMMAIPLLMLYQISIWVSMVGYGRKQKREQEWEDEYK